MRYKIISLIIVATLIISCKSTKTSVKKGKPKYSHSAPAYEDYFKKKRKKSIKKLWHKLKQDKSYVADQDSESFQTQR